MLASHLGITATTLSKKLRGTVPLTVDELVLVGELLEVSPSSLLGEGEPLDPAEVVRRVHAELAG